MESKERDEILKAQIALNRLPKHIAIIMDGNGRWAQLHGMARVFGHQSGVESVREVTEAAAEIGIEYLTLYAFSTENWNRPNDEVNALMALLVKTIQAELPTLNKNNIRLQCIGDIESLPEATRLELLDAMQQTAHNSRMTLILALSYSAKWEIVQAVKNISEKVSKGILHPDAIDETLIANELATKGIPDPELMIRTGGETRISNFLLWQIAYAELSFTKVFWPDFRKNDLYEAIIDFQQRQRRFGKTGDQIETFL
jgi:undecaprenyl diphosphate synthase